MPEDRSGQYRPRLFLFMLYLGCFGTFGGPASSMSWDDAIASVEAKAIEIWSLAESRGLQSRFLGTAFNELHAREHSCSILGRMLGKADAIAEAESSTEFDLEQADEHETGLAAHSLDNWVHNARRLKELSEERRIEEWNLDCVGQYGIPGNEFVARSGTETFFDLQHEGRVLRILGDVNAGFASRMRSALAQNPSVTTVALGSAGGRVMEAIEAGRLIRQRGLETTLWNECYSACTLVFLGGVERKIWSPYPNLHFHQARLHGAAIPLDDELYGDVFRYAETMNVNPYTFLHFMLSASPSEFYSASRDELCDANIATWIQRWC